MTAAGDGAQIVFRQTNHEGVLVDWIQEARTHACAIMINPAGYGHTSVAVLDALCPDPDIRPLMVPGAVDTVLLLVSVWVLLYSVE